MRKIKFRVWDKEKKEMKTCCPNYLVGGDGTLHWQFGLQEPWPLIAREHEVMQYTGLKDKNGKEVWEGDIMLSKDRLRRHVVAYNDCAGRWKLDGLGKAWNDSDPSWFELEVVGNIHENGDLLYAEN